jgi:hypothetical protein
MTALLWGVSIACGICSAAVVMSIFSAGKRADDFNDDLSDRIQHDPRPLSVWNAGQPRIEGE